VTAPAAAPAPAPTAPAPAAAAPAPAQTPAPAEAKPTAAELAAKAEPLYKNNCLACHGDKLQGEIGPDISKVGGHRTKEQLIQKITGGGQVMPPFKEALKPEEVEALAAWLATKK
jgi:mono/diheme cytochrome c family protein